jgi:hypothetical protein
VFKAGAKTPVPYLPHDEPDACLARVRDFKLPSPYNLIVPDSINDQSWLLLGIMVGRHMHINYLTRILQITQVEPALTLETSAGDKRTHEDDNDTSLADMPVAKKSRETHRP